MTTAAKQDAAIRTTPVRGVIRSAYNDYLHHRKHEKPTWKHAAIDITAQLGDPVYAPESGRVYKVVGPELTEKRGTYYNGYGPKVVVLKGDSGVWHWLCHLGTASVHSNEDVKVGEQIGTIGKRGRSKPHVHWETRRRLHAKYSRVKPTEYPWHITIDPLSWLHGNTIDAISVTNSWPANRNLGVTRGSAYPIVLSQSKLPKSSWTIEFKKGDNITALPPPLTKPRPRYLFPAPVNTGLGFVLVLGLLVYFSMKQK